MNASLDHCWLFVCLFLANKQELPAPTFPHLSPTCSHCNSSSHLSINQASDLPPLPMVNSLAHEQLMRGRWNPVGIVSRTGPLDSTLPPRLLTEYHLNIRVSCPHQMVQECQVYLSRPSLGSFDSAHLLYDSVDPDHNNSNSEKLVVPE